MSLRRATGVSVAFVAASMALLTSPVGAMPPMGSMSSMPSMSTSAAPPLAGGVNDAGTSMSIIPMGHLSDSANTYFQSFTAHGDASWNLSTPPGIATNGGLTLSSPSNGAIAVLPYYALHLSAISPLVDGVSSQDGEAVTSLLKAPSAMAKSPHSGAFFLVTTKGSVLEQSGPTQPFTTVTSLSALKKTSAGKRCGIQAITGIAIQSDESLALGVRCASPGTTGVLTQSGGSWTGTLASKVGPCSVVRIDPSGAGVIALVRTGGMKASLRSISIAGSSVKLSSPLPFMYSTLRSTAVSNESGGGRSDIVALAGTTHVAAAILTPGEHVHAVASVLPLSTRALVAQGTAPISPATLRAFEVSNGKATIQELTASSAWETLKVVNVKIPYGSTK